MTIPGIRLKALQITAVALMFCAPLFAQTVPHTEAESLSGKKIVLPDAASGKLAVLIVGFSHKSSTPMKEWAQRIDADYRSNPGIIYFQVPVIASAPRMVRGMIMHGMKKDVPKDKYETFAVVTRDEIAWKQAAGFDRPDDAYILLLDATGNIRWKTSGTAEAHYTELKTQIAQLATPK
ncbi:MAG: hypothetical protein LAP21_11800 [Acidobacteriia bacterium]|nr:hypothetical protein [Terriglobia bacterium]